MRVSGLFVTLTAAVGLLLSGCAPTPGEPEIANGVEPVPPTGSQISELSDPDGVRPDPVGLINLWRVSGAEGETEETWLRIDATELQLWRDCGITTGSWQSNGSLFAASMWAADPACATGSPQVPWLEAVTSYRAVDDGWELVNSAGEVAASLSIDGAPKPIATAADFYTEAPIVTDATKDALRQPQPLPVHLVAAVGADIVGRWQPVDYDGSLAPYVLFERGSDWTGSDGCNGAGGRWATDGAGALLITSGPSTLMMCDGASLPSVLSQARMVAIDGDLLLLLDAEGREIGQLKPA
jgi:heat shock protein HslJ